MDPGLLQWNVVETTPRPSHHDQQLEDIAAGHYTRAPTLLDFDGACADDTLPWPLQPGICGTWPSRSMQLYYRSQRRGHLLDTYLENLKPVDGDPANILYSETAENSWCQVTPFRGVLIRIGQADTGPYGRWCKLTGLALRAWSLYFLVINKHKCSDGVRNLVSKRLRARLAWSTTQVLNEESEFVTWPQLSLAESRMLFKDYTMAALDDHHGTPPDDDLPTFVRWKRTWGSDVVQLCHFEYGEEGLPSFERTVAFDDQ